VTVGDTAEHLFEELAGVMVVVLDQQQAVARTIEPFQGVPQTTEFATHEVALGTTFGRVSKLGHPKGPSVCEHRELTGILPNSGRCLSPARIVELGLGVLWGVSRKTPGYSR
jgi:hypothetical protein